MSVDPGANPSSGALDLARELAAAFEGGGAEPGGRRLLSRRRGGPAEPLSTTDEPAAMTQAGPAPTATDPHPPLSPSHPPTLPPSPSQPLTLGPAAPVQAGAFLLLLDADTWGAADAEDQARKDKLAAEVGKAMRLGLKLVMAHECDEHARPEVRKALRRRLFRCLLPRRLSRHLLLRRLPR